MVELRIQEVAMKRGITTAYQLQKALESHPAMAARLWKGDMDRIGLQTVDALCEALDCEPGDLIVRVKTLTEGKRKKAKQEKS